MKTLALLLGLVGAALVLATIGSASVAQPSPISRSSTFDSSNDGWVTVTKLGRRSARWNAAGGNPGGYITSGFSRATFLSNSDTWAGNALGDYGGRLQVDLKASAPGAHAEIELYSTNSDAWSCLDTGVLPQDWHTYSITLDTTGLTRCDGSPFTAAQLRAALVGFAGVEVISPNNDPGPDLSVDNASLSGPQTPVTAPTGTATRSLTLRYVGGAYLHHVYVRHRFLGRIGSLDDFSCLGPMKVTIFRNAKKPVEVGTATTRTTTRPAWESFSFKLKTVVKGSYYASVTNSESPLDGNTCDAARSKGVRVR